MRFTVPDPAGGQMTITTCDICKDNAPVLKCDICGKDVCTFCRATVHFHQKEMIRGLEIPFVYDRVICQSHLPKGFKHSDGSEVVTGTEEKTEDAPVMKPEPSVIDPNRWVGECPHCKNRFYLDESEWSDFEQRYICPNCHRSAVEPSVPPIVIDPGLFE